MNPTDLLDAANAAAAQAHDSVSQPLRVAVAVYNAVADTLGGFAANVFAGGASWWVPMEDNPYR